MLSCELTTEVDCEAGVDRGGDEAKEEVSIQRKAVLVLVQSFLLAAGLKPIVVEAAEEAAAAAAAAPAASLRRCFTPIRWSSVLPVVIVSLCCAERAGEEAEIVSLLLFGSKSKGLAVSERLLADSSGSSRRSSAGVTTGLAVDVVVPG